MHNWKIEFTIRVLQILMSTDEKHPINTTQIMTKLKDWYNMDCSERRTVYDAVNLLRRMDLNIESCPVKRDGYYLVGMVSLAQIKMLFDTVTRSKLYTEETKHRIIRKVFGMISPEYRRLLKAMPQLRAKYHATDEQTGEYINLLMRSVADKRQVDFHYLAYDIEMHPVFKHNMKWYHISPYYVYHANDTCYLIGAELEPDESIDKVKHFRLDRICNLLPSDRECIDIHRYYSDPSVGLAEYIFRCIDHYGGEDVELELEVPYSEKAMYIIRDMCGTNFTCHKIGPDRAKISFHVRSGPPLIGWIMQNAHLFKVIGPPSVVETVRAEYRFGYEMYAANKGV